MDYKWNPKIKDSGIITAIPQKGECPNKCADCFFQSGRSYLEPLADNLPHLPPPGWTEGRIVRMNDGNDSNVDRNRVLAEAGLHTDVFFNTAIPKNLDTFPGPVVLTINPGEITDTDYFKIDPIPKNLMFVRIRVNTWNYLTVVDEAVEYYTSRGVPVVLTPMAYYEETIPEGHTHNYEWKKRTINSYWCMTREASEVMANRYKDNVLVYTCGYKGTYPCARCGNCVREYHVTKERLRDDK